MYMRQNRISQNTFFSKQAGRKDKNLHDSISYVRKHLFSKRGSIGRQVISLNKHRAIGITGITTKQNFMTRKFDTQLAKKIKMHISQIRIFKDTLLVKAEQSFAAPPICMSTELLKSQESQQSKTS